MKQTLIRLLLFTLLFLLFCYVILHNQPEAVLWAFVGTYIFEGAVTKAVTR